MQRFHINSSGIPVFLFIETFIESSAAAVVVHRKET
jgi:hypothetical protein